MGDHFNGVALYYVLLQGTHREMASVLISDLYGKQLSQNDIAKGMFANIIYNYL